MAAQTGRPVKVPRAVYYLTPQSSSSVFAGVGVRRCSPGHERLNMDKQDGQDWELKLEYQRFTRSTDFKQG